MKRKVKIYQGDIFTLDIMILDTEADDKRLHPLPKPPLSQHIWDKGKLLARTNVLFSRSYSDDCIYNATAKDL